MVMSSGRSTTCSTTLLPEFFQLTGVAERHVRLVKLLRSWFHRRGGVPEYTEHSHPCAIVPNGSRDTASRFRYPAHFAERPAPVGNEIKCKEREAVLKRRVGKAQLLCVADMKSYTVRKGIPAICVGDVFFRWI